MDSFPMTAIGGEPISRMIAGSNWFRGYSHYSSAKDKWIREYMTLELITEVLCVFACNGINAYIAMPDDQTKEVLRRVKEETGVTMHLIATPSGEHIDDLLPGIEASAEAGARFCLPHQHWTDGNLVANEQRIIGIEQATRRIRELGMIPGLSTHRPETVVICDKAGYDVETYIQIYNAIGFLCQVETDWIERVINNSPKPIICIKPLAGGRILPPTGLSFVYHSIKPIDTICIGTLSVGEAEDDIRIARGLLAGSAVQARELQYSRSKKSLT
ncbi:MAG: hypothetical protein GXY52_09295 [Chloroflexi bacterium]|nr:hypothetical protein [Chloroflexota bacterium]